MRLPGPPAPPATAGEALLAISAGLDYLNAADVASLTTAEQAGCLRALEQATSKHTAARSKVPRCVPRPGRLRWRRPRVDQDLAEVADPDQRRRGQ